jgi:uncharacterized protein YkwD
MRPIAGGMVLRLRHVSAAAAIASTLALLAVLVSAPRAEARGAACTKYGKTVPAKLKKPQARKAILCLLNEERASHGLPDFARSKKLQRAAQKHSARMSGSGCFDHQCPGEGDLVSRLGTVDYLFRSLSRWICAENIAWGMTTAGTPRAIMDAWMKSDGHRANILNGDLRQVGVGFAKGSPTDGDAPAGMYTTDFGSRSG